jgi:hypothetical protein
MKKIVGLLVLIICWYSSFADGEEVIWNIYPNPFENYVAIEWQQNNPGSIRLMLYDLRGKMVKEVEVHAKTGSNAYIVEFEDLPSGPYNFFFYNPLENKMYHGKIIRK